jgi:hypothetical protein
MRQQGPFHSGRSGCRTNRRKFHSVRNQATAVKRYPLTGIGTRFLGEPLKFFATVVDRGGDGRGAVLRHGLIFERQAHSLMFWQSKRLKRSQDSMFVNGLKLTDHSTFIVTVGRVGIPQTP